MKKEIPYFAIGNDKLKKKKPLGDTIKCPHCGQEHKVEYGERVMPDGTKVPSKTLAFYKCGEKLFLAGIDGKEI